MRSKIFEIVVQGKKKSIVSLVTRHIGLFNCILRTVHIPKCQITKVVRCGVFSLFNVVNIVVCQYHIVVYLLSSFVRTKKKQFRCEMVMNNEIFDAKLKIVSEPINCSHRKMVIGCVSIGHEKQTNE